MSKPWTSFYWADWEKHTGHLTLAENGAYFRLVSHYYTTGKPLPAIASRLLGVCRAIATEEQQAVATVLAQFFILDGDVYRHERCDEELQKAKKLSELRSKIGRKGAKIKAEAKATAIAKAKADTVTVTYIEDTETTTSEVKRKGAVDNSPRIPTLEECQAYWKEKNWKSDAIAFFFHYEAINWTMPNGSPIVRWKAKANAWERREIVPRQPAGADRINGLRRPHERDAKAWLDLCHKYDIPTIGKTNDELWVKITAAYNREQHQNG